VRPNSTIVVKDTTSLFGGKNVRVSLGDGQLNVRTGDQPADVKNIVEVADTENRLMPKTDASFDADQQTNGGEIRISRGGVETTVGGEKSTINENEFASVNGGKLSDREKLLAPPRPIAPIEGAQIVDSRGGVNVAFSWQDAEGSGAASYDLQISKSATFAADAMLVDRSKMAGRDFRLAGLQPGTYYWRLRAMSRSGQTTQWNDSWKFNVVRGGGGDPIDATGWQAERLGGNVYLVSGRTAPGRIIRWQGHETNAGPDGTFRVQVSSPLTEATIEIADDRGNQTRFVISLKNGSVLRRN
ncbi:MAG: hypothetical protein ABJB40_09275, partial [Acidobacteriota bacterium]